MNLNSKFIPTSYHAKINFGPNTKTRCYDSVENDPILVLGSYENIQYQYPIDVLKGIYEYNNGIYKC